ESAGYVPETCPGPVGVFAGASRSQYFWNLISNPEVLQAVGAYKVGLATDKDFLTTNVSYKLDLKGPSLSVQTACSTSLVAVHVACRSLLAGECDMALAGGASIEVPQRAGYLYQEGGIRSPDGHCRAFDARAQGTVAGSGVGAVLLKRLDDALADGDPIHAVILGSAINNDGSGKVGYTAPSVDGQAQVLRAALEAAEVDPKTVRYIETHGTGTPLGDPIEIAALTQAFREAGAEEPGFCAIGSVKTNIGHLDAASGLAGLIKAVLALEHRQIPPSLHFTEPNPQIDFAHSPFRVNELLRDWPADGGPRRAGVSSFGIGGTNAHAVLEEAPPAEPGSPPRHPGQLLVLSARTPAALEQASRDLGDFLAAHPDVDLADAAWTLQTGRRAFEHRRAVLCRDTAEAVAALAGPGGERAGEERGVVFLFPGQGAQHPGMGLGLYRSEPVFREEIGRAAAGLGFDLRELLESEEADWEDTALAQPALFAVEHALARLWMSWGLRPAALIGHSLGEYVAACLAGVFSFEDGLALVAERGRLLGELPRGAMASLPLSEEETLPLLSGGLSLAAVNGPAQCVVSGPGEEVSALLEELAGRGVEGRLLRTSHAFHSAMMEPAVAPFAAAAGRIRLSPPQIPWISNVTGTWITAAQATDPGYWAQHLRETVRFADGLSTLLAGSSAALLEAGPGRTLSALARRHPARTPAHKVVTSLRHPDDPKDDVETVLSALGQLWSAGVPVDWREVHAGERRRRVVLPTYPFERRRYWIERRKGIAGPALPAPGRRELADWFWTPFWEPAPPVRTGEEARGPWLVFLGDGSLGEALLDELHGLGAETVVVRPGARPWHREDYDALLARIAQERGRVPSRILHLGSVEPPEPAEGLPQRLVRLERETDRGFYSLLFLLQALGERGGAESFEVTVVTSSAQRVAAGDLPCPERAMMHALGLVAPREHPGLTCRAIDIGFPVRRPWLGRIAADLAAPFSAPLSAWRGGERWLPDVAPLRLEERAPLPAEGVWLITGGLGAIGLEIAEHLAATRARLVLVGRTGLPSAEEKAPEAAASPHLAGREIELRRGLGVQGIASRPGAQEALDAFTSARLLRFLVESGIEVRRGARLDRQELQTALRLLPKFHRFLDFLLDVLAEDGWVRQDGDAVVFAIDAAEAPDPTVLAREAAARHPVLWPILERVEQCAAGYGPALSGEDEALSVLFSDGGGGELAESLSYQPVYLGLAAGIAEEAAERSAREGRPLRVLEIGGGQGNLTRRVAPALAGRNAEYWFTDLGRLFVTEAEREAERAGLDFLRFGVLDASRDPVAQGYAAESFDLIFALNVVHATPDVEATLGHLRRLLRPGGSLCLIELTGRQRWVDMIWGLAEGWWLFSDAFRQGSPLLGLDAWREALTRTGFEIAAALPEDREGRADSDCGLLLATRPTATSPAARVRRLRELGAQVVVETADVAEAGALSAVARRTVERFGRLDGVIHAAGVPGGGLLELRTRESLEAELAAKVRGALAVGEVCRELSPERLVLFSSTSAFTGQLGQAGYCAANAFLDAWAHLHAAETGMATLTLDWDRWQGIGMAVEVERRHRELTGHELTGGISAAEGAEAFARALASGRTQVIVSPEDFAARLARERNAPSVSAAVEPRQPAPASLHERPDLSTGYVPPADELERDIAEIWQEVFAIERIGIEDDFFELGGDSLVALQLVSRLSDAIGLELRVRNLFEAPTIAALASYVEEAMLAGASEDELALTGGREALS
ncbi:MAG TPA: SDR family NAD(P)-dependent oxidoreductase, partial [Thermoanaerobaculia bacterium]|nr:SDR family NAD(P)-dependent oxidoreductase [Thermoanaerobaculia bacterium]